jgi:hypothetical protein
MRTCSPTRARPGSRPFVGVMDTIRSVMKRSRVRLAAGSELIVAVRLRGPADVAGQEGHYGQLVLTESELRRRLVQHLDRHSIVVMIPPSIRRNQLRPSAPGRRSAIHLAFRCI